MNAKQARRASVIEVLLNNVAVTGGKATTCYNALVFTQPTDSGSAWYAVKDDGSEAKMTLEEVIDFCIADDHRLAAEASYADLGGLVYQLSRLLSSRAGESKHFDRGLCVTPLKYLHIIDEHKGVLGVSPQPSSPPVDFMLYRPGVDVLDSDNWPNGELERPTVGEVLKEIKVVWPAKNKKIALRDGNYIFTFYPDSAGKTFVIVTDPHGNVLCRIGAY